MSNILDDFDFDSSYNWEDEPGEVVGKYYSSIEADVAAARLRDAGIPCFVANAITQSTMPHLQGYVRLHVRPEQAEAAKSILAEAAIDADVPGESSGIGNGAIYALLGLILAILLYLLVVSMGL